MIQLNVQGADLDALRAGRETPDWSRTICHLGDVHLGAGDVPLRSTYAQRALLALLPADGSCAALVQVGDGCESNPTDAQDAAFRSYVTQFPAAFTSFVVGNHDKRSPGPERTGTAAAASINVSPGGAKDWIHDLDFIRLIGISPEELDPDDGSILFDTPALDLLSDGLDQAPGGCAIFGHAPLAGTVICENAGINAGYSSTDVGFGAKPDAELRALLAHPNAKSYTSGHTHSFMSAIGFVTVVDLGDGNSIVSINSSAIRGQHRPYRPSDPILIAFTTYTRDGGIETRIHDAVQKRWARWPDTGQLVKRFPMP